MSNTKNLYPPEVDGVFQETMEAQLNTVGALLALDIKKLEQLLVERGGSLENGLTISQVQDPNQKPSADDPLEFIIACSAQLGHLVEELQALK